MSKAEVLWTTCDELPGFTIRAFWNGRHCEVVAEKDGRRISTPAKTYDEGLETIIAVYRGERRLDPHRGGHKCTGTPVVVNQPTLDAYIAAAREARRETFERAGGFLRSCPFTASIGVALLSLLFVGIIVVLAAAYGHWDSQLWLDAVQ